MKVYHRYLGEYKTPPPFKAGAFSSRLLDSADLDRVGSFRTVRNFKGHLVAFAKLIELYVHELVGVEKEILFLSFDLDEPETLFSESGDCSFLHSNEKITIKIKTGLEWKLDPYFSWISAGLMREG